MKHSWTNKDKRAVLDHLGPFISLGAVRGMQKEPRDPEQLFMDSVKFFVKNEVERQKARVKK